MLTLWIFLIGEKIVGRIRNSIYSVIADPVKNILGLRTISNCDNTTQEEEL